MKLPIRRINEWLILILAFFIVTLGVPYVLSEVFGIKLLSYNAVTPVPTVNVLGLATTDAINQFRGKPVVGFGLSKDTIFILTGVLLNLFLGPWLWYLGFKKAQTSEHKAKPWSWYVGGIICISSLIIIPSTVISMRVQKKTAESAAVSREKDQMRQEALGVSFALAEYHLLSNHITEDFDVEEIDLPELSFDHEIVSVSGDSLMVLKTKSPNYDHISVIADIRPFGTPLILQRN